MGACCKFLPEEPFPGMEGFNRGDGVCKHLQDGACSIYEDRPVVCRTDAMWELFYSKHMSWEEYIDRGKACCEALRDRLTNK